MQTVQPSNWYHRGDGDQSGAVLIEKPRSLFFIRNRANGHKATVKSSKRWWSSEAASAAARLSSQFITRAGFTCSDIGQCVLWARWWYVWGVFRWPSSPSFGNPRCSAFMWWDTWFFPTIYFKSSPFYFSNQAVTQIRASAARYASNSLFKVSCKVSILCCRFKTTQSLILVVILARPATVLLACEVFFLFVSRDFPEYFLPAAPTAERGFAQPTLGKIL